jgi:hypothetical protein
MRISDPSSTGTATAIESCTSDRPRSSCRSGPSGRSSAQPYHWPGPIAANNMTIDALDPLSRMPGFKVCAVRVERGTDIDPVPTPPVPPGEEPYGPEVRPLAERRSPTMPQGRGTSES